MLRFGYFESVTSPEMVNQLIWRLFVKGGESCDKNYIKWVISQKVTNKEEKLPILQGYL